MLNRFDKIAINNTHAAEVLACAFIACNPTGSYYDNELQLHAVLRFHDRVAHRSLPLTHPYIGGLWFETDNTGHLVDDFESIRDEAFLFMDGKDSK